MDVHEYYLHKALDMRTQEENLALADVDIGKDEELKEELMVILDLLSETEGVCDAWVWKRGEENSEKTHSHHLIRVYYKNVTAIKKIAPLLNALRLDISLRYGEDVWLESNYQELIDPASKNYKSDPCNLRHFGEKIRERHLNGVTVFYPWVRAISDNKILRQSLEGSSFGDKGMLACRLFLRKQLPQSVDSKEVFEITFHNWQIKGSIPLIDVGILGHRNSVKILRTMRKAARELAEKTNQVTVFDYLIVEDGPLTKLIR